MERKEKFTPPPWEVSEASDGGMWLFGDNRNFVVAHVQGRRENQGGANAALIAAAPDMYEALQTLKSAMLDVLDCADLPDDVLTAADEALEKAERAMKKARGEE